MPSQKPRLALTLPDELKAAIDALADATQKPASKVVTELLQEMLPQLHGMAKFSRAVRAGNITAAKTALRHTMGDTLAQVMIDTTPDLFDKKRRRK